eukprot:scaffold172369_cov18-Prasinocladus_malaysianus.AAC.1
MHQRCIHRADLQIFTYTTLCSHANSCADYTLICRECLALSIPSFTYATLRGGVERERERETGKG